MKKLHFDSPQDFKSRFDGDINSSAFEDVAAAIYEAVKFQKKTAIIYEIHFEGADSFFEITLPKSQWIQAVEHCKEGFEKSNEFDKAFEAFNLIEEIKKWDL